MNKSIVLALGALALSLTAAGQAPDLETCVEMAFKNYPQIMEYDLIETSSKYDIQTAAYSWIPQLTISGKATWQSAVVEMPFDIPGMQLDIPHTQFGVAADLNQQIWDGGASEIRRKLIAAESDVRKKQLEVNLYSIRQRVQNIYLGIKLIDKQIELNDLLAESLDRTEQETEALVESGVAKSTDLDQVKVNLLSCKQQRQGLETDRKAYVRMLGIMTGTDFTNATFPELGMPAAQAESREAARPEFALYDAQAKQAELQQKQLNVNIWPKFNLNVQAGYGRPGLNMLSGKFDPYVTAGIKFQWNFGSLYSLKNDRRKASAEAERVDLARKSFEVNNSIEAVEKRSAMEKAADVMAMDEEIIALRHSISESAETQYKEGVIKMNDYLGLLDDEFKARLDANIHHIQYVMAVCDLHNTLGY